MNDTSVFHEANPRGFAAMPKDKQRAIAQLGGQTAQANGTAHKYTSETGRAAGKKGGKAISQLRAHMQEIGRKGGAVAARNRRQRQALSPNAAALAASAGLIVI